MNTLQRPKLIAVVGPTASGKSALALALAEEFKGELICTDSMQVYQEMNIGTAKPTHQEQARVPHHQLDLVLPDQHYSVARYLEDVNPIIERLHAAQTPTFLVGGTGLYFRGTLYGICQTPPIPADLKQQIQHWQQEHGTLYCHQELARLDSEAAAILKPRDTTRVLRALEVVMASGRSILRYQEETPFGTDPRYELLSLGVHWPRSQLYERINQRTVQMLEQGWIEETKALMQQYPVDCQGLKAIGYSQIIAYLNQELSDKEMIGQIQQKTRNYAKRQLTWFRKDESIRWLEPEQFALARELVSEFLERKPR